MNTEDLQYIFDSAGETILVNGVERTAIVTNPAISEYEERYIHTLDKVFRGSLIIISDERYICITESVTKRHSKYKTLIRHCNYTIEIKNYTQVYIGDNAFGVPVYQDVYVDSNYIPAIVNNKTLSVDNQSAIRLANNQIEVIVQDNTLNNSKFVVNNKFSVASKNWKVINVDKSKNGLLILTCEFVV